MDWVSFEEIKKTVTLQMALDRYKVPLRRVNAHSLRGRCPLPTPPLLPPRIPRWNPLRFPARVPACR